MQSKKPHFIPEKTQISYDSIFKRFIDHLSDENIVAFINGTFDRHYPLESPVARLSTESNTANRMLSDIILRVDESVFHIELQSSDDSSMALRVFEYGVRSAMQHGKTQDNGITIRFPEPVVFYLRTTRETPGELAVNIEFPHINQTVRYTVPAQRLSDLTPEAMLERSLIPLLPFYPMKYESVAIDENQARRELTSICRGMAALHKDGKLSEKEIADMFNVLCEICKKAAENANNNSLKEVAKSMAAMDTIYMYDVWDLTEKAEIRGKAEGKAEGIAEGIAEGEAVAKAETQDTTLRFMLRAGITDEIIARYVRECGISETRFTQIKDEILSAGNAEPDKESVLKRIRESKPEQRKTDKAPKRKKDEHDR